jgi:ankyrin repeat protein
MIQLKKMNPKDQQDLNSALFQACEQGWVIVVKLLLEAGADPTYRDNMQLITTLIKAVYANNLAIVKLLLEYGANPNDGDYYEEETGFTMACRFVNYNMVKLFLQECVIPSDHLNHALIYAACRSKKIVEILLEYGADPTCEAAIENAATAEIKDLLLKYKYKVDGEEYQRLKEYADKN